MSNVIEIGTVSRLGGEKLKIVKINTEYYFCLDVGIFQQAGPSQWPSQRIERIIGDTIFYPRGTIKVYEYVNKNDKSILSDIRESNVDPILLKIVQLCESADHSDVEIFKYCKSISVFKEMHEIGSDLGRGLGFPGKGFGLIVANFDFPIYKRRVYLQIVHSYNEGYSVEHQELTPEIFALSHLPGIEQFLKNE